MPRPPNPPAPRPHNPIRNQRQIRAPTPLLTKATANAAAAALRPAARPPKRLCPNKECPGPKVEDGVCKGCGTVVDDSNIVAEIQFGENSQGGQVMMGTSVSHERGYAIPGGGGGVGGRRSRVPGGGESSSRDATINEGKHKMQGFAGEFGINPGTVDEGIQIFKLAATSNFIQGRRIDMVAAVCLYSACRKHAPCNVMLIDFAEKLQVNVFKLGHTFKSLHRAVTVSKEGIAPIIPEDLIYRFAMKLEFGDLMSKVAETAITLAQRMGLDWMVMGRRPAGVCGACLIVAARMHNFRRTVTEVVYIVKVTTATIQKRLDEFKLTPSSTLSVEEFMNGVKTGAPHDPPSFYEKQEEFIKTKKTRKRKRRGELLEDDEEENQEGDEADPNKRQKTATPNPDGALPTVELRRDADGFAIPPQPPRLQTESEFVDIVEEAAENPTQEALEKLARKFVGEEGTVPTSDGENEDDDDGTSSTTSATTTPKRSRRKQKPAQEYIVSAEWSEEEEQIAETIRQVLADKNMAEMIFDPLTDHYRVLYEMAEKQAKKHMADFEQANPSKNVRDDEDILEDEFANDPEVQNCLLSPEDIARKEKVWVNENKSWLRLQQIKAYQKRMADNGPPKRTRNRKKMVRIGEGQASPASSAGEAAVSVLQSRALSKKIDYNVVGSLFDDMDGPGGGALGSAATSRVTSRAGSSVPESPSASGSESNDEDSVMGEEDENDYIKPAKPTAATRTRTPQPPPDLSEDEDDPEDYVQEDDEEPAWKNQGDRGIYEGGDGDDEGQSEDGEGGEGGDMNDIEGVWD